MRLCRLCKERPANTARVKHYDYRCNPCRKQSPAYLASEHRYNRTEKRVVSRRLRNHNRIYIGSVYHSAAKTVEQAREINRYVRERMCHFRETRDKNEN